MRGPFLRVLIVLSACCLLPFAADAGAGIADVAESDPGMFMMMMLMLTGFLAGCVVIVGILLALAAACCAVVLSGIASVSMVAAWYHRSAGYGMRLFILLSAALAGLTGGCCSGWLLHRLFYPQTDLLIVIAMTAAAGCAAGILTARLGLMILNRLYRRLAG